MHHGCNEMENQEKDDGIVYNNIESICLLQA